MNREQLMQFALCGQKGHLHTPTAEVFMSDKDEASLVSCLQS